MKNFLHNLNFTTSLARLTFAIFFLGIFILFHSLNAEAYTTLGPKWPGGSPQVEYYINVDSFPSSVGTTTQIITAINNGVNHWNDAGADFEFVYMGTTTVATRDDDGINVVFYDTSNCNAGSGCIVQTAWWASGNDMTDFDISFHAKNSQGNNVTWDAVDPIFFTQDVWSNAAHEFGHALGLGHSSTPSATMSGNIGSSATWPRYLVQDDINGIIYLYGTP